MVQTVKASKSGSEKDVEGFLEKIEKSIRKRKEEKRVGKSAGLLIDEQVCIIH